MATLAPPSPGSRTREALGALSAQGVGPAVPMAAAAPPAGEDDAAILSTVRMLFSRAREARRPLLAQWRKNYKVLNNRVWSARAEPWVPAPELAEMWPIICSLNAWLTDQRPVIEVLPSAIPFSPYADYFAQLAADMTAAVAVTFSDNLLDAEINRALWDVHTYGIAWFKTAWEPWLADGLGDVVFRRVDPFTIYPDPYARTPEQMNYIIEAKVMSVGDVERAYPGKGLAAAMAGWLEDAEQAPHRLDATVNPAGPRVNLNALAGNTGPNRWGASNRGTKATDTPTVTVLECWVRTSRPRTVNLPDGTTTKRSVESWRCITVCGNRVLVNADASEINSFNGHPYDRLVAFDTGEMVGPCLAEMLTSPQESINRTLSNIEYNIALMANPMLVEDPRSGIRNKRITNRPGQRLEANPQSVAWLNPPQMHPTIAMDLLRFYKGEMESISGLSAIVRGFSPSGRNSQGVMDSVQDAAFVRVRSTLRELERSLKSTGKKVIASIAELYTEPRLLSILGPDGQRTSQLLKARHFYVPNDRADPQDPTRMPLRFNLLADAGSQLATSREARSADAAQLFALGAIDVPELLKAKQWPNWGVVAQRVQQMQAAVGTLGQPPGSRQASRTPTGGPSGNGQ